MKKRLSVVLIFVVAFLLIACGISAFAAESNYPNRQITVVVPYAPGGGVDAYSRVMADFMAAKTGQTVIIENLPGAGSVVGWNSVQQRAADGYTITSATGSANPWAMRATQPFSWENDAFTFIGRIIENPSSSGIVVSSKSKWQNFSEFMNDVKSGEPKTINLAVHGPNQMPELLVADMERLFNVKFNKILYPGSSEIQTAILTGDVDAGITSANREVFVKNENFRILALFGKEVPAEYPVQGLPMIADFAKEFGWKWEDQKYLDIPQGGGYMMVKTGTPPEIVEYLTKLIKDICDDPDFKEKIKVTAMSYWATPEECLEIMEYSGKAMKEFVESNAAAK